MKHWQTKVHYSLSHTHTVCAQCPNTEFFLARIQKNTDQKKLRIWPIFTQCVCVCVWESNALLLFNVPQKQLIFIYLLMPKTVSMETQCMYLIYVYPWDNFYYYYYYYYYYYHSFCYYYYRNFLGWVSY